jgi:hypothetical protein
MRTSILDEEIDRLRGQLAGLEYAKTLLEPASNGQGTTTRAAATDATTPVRRRHKKFSKAARRAMSIAQRKRWAVLRQQQAKRAKPAHA